MRWLSVNIHCAELAAKSGPIFVNRFSKSLFVKKNSKGLKTKESEEEVWPCGLRQSPGLLVNLGLGDFLLWAGLLVNEGFDFMCRWPVVVPVDLASCCIVFTRGLCSYAN